MKYLFDTDILSNLMKRHPSPRLLKKLGELSPKLQYTSSITIGELYYGVYRIAESDLIIEKIEKLILPSLQKILPFEEEAAKEYGKVRAQLESRGESLSEPDIRIAAICLVNEAVLVTGNTRHFEKIENLRIENWL